MKTRTKKAFVILAAFGITALTALYFLDPQVFDAVMPFDTDPTDCCVQDPQEGQ